MLVHPDRSLPLKSGTQSSPGALGATDWAAGRGYVGDIVGVWATRSDWQKTTAATDKHRQRLATDKHRQRLATDKHGLTRKNLKVVNGIARIVFIRKPIRVI